MAIERLLSNCRHAQPIQSVYSGLFSWLKNRFPETTDKLPAYAELIRLDKPIGILLLLWPTIGALWIAAEGFPGFYLSLFSYSEQPSCGQRAVALMISLTLT